MGPGRRSAVVLGLALLGAVLLGLAGCGDTDSSGAGDPRIGGLPAGVVARVGDTDITRAALDARLAGLLTTEARLAAREGGHVRTRSPAESADEVRSELEWLVEVAIFEALAARCGAPCAVTPADVDAEMDRVYGGSRARMEADLAANGLDLAQGREEMRLLLLGRRLSAHAIAGVTFTEEDARAYYAAHPDRYADRSIPFSEARGGIIEEQLEARRRAARAEWKAVADPLEDDLRASVVYASREYAPPPGVTAP